MRMRTGGCAAVILVLLMAGGAGADVQLAPVFGDHMVLQRDVKVPIWGTAAPGEEIHITFGDQHTHATPGADGRWKGVLNPLKAGGPFELVVHGTNHVTIRDVMVGEVWIASGQSNMEWPVNQSTNAETEIPAARYPKIRLLKVQRRVSSKPQSSFTGRWEVCSPETIPSFSAVAYYFGRHLHKELDVPIGLIASAWGGTPAEAWTPNETLIGDPLLASIHAHWSKTIADYTTAIRNNEKAREWAEASIKAEEAGEIIPEAPKEHVPADPRVNPHRAAGLYNGMIAPLVPFAIRGAIWYQGESNAGRAHQYRTLFPAMIESWRKAWGQGDFPFLFVQLAAFAAHQPGKPVPPDQLNKEPGDDAWSELREAQTMTLKLPNTGMAVTIDIGEPNDIHPKNKQDVGKRLALWALATTFKKDLVYSGPLYKSVELKGNQAVLKFDHLGGGLTTNDGKPPRGFAVAGSDHKFVWADAKIDGDTVIVSSDKVPAIASVRYAWLSYPDCNLANKAGLPASPFRTDDWPGITVGK